MHGFTSLSLSLSPYFFGGREGVVLCCPAYSILKALWIIFQELRIILYFSLVCVGVLLCLAFFLRFDLHRQVYEMALSTCTTSI